MRYVYDTFSFFTVCGGSSTGSIHKHRNFTVFTVKTMAKTLYVGNLPYSWTGDNLRELFAQAGAVTSSSVISDRDSGRSKGFGFVDMESDDDAQKAIEQFNGYSAEGRELRVNEARPKEERPRFGGGGGGARNGGFRSRSFGSRNDYNN